MKIAEIQDAVGKSFRSYHWDQDGTRLAEQVSPVRRRSRWDFDRMRTNVYLDTNAISDVASRVRLAGPAYLNSLSIAQVASLLRGVVRENVWRACGNWPAREVGQLALPDSDVDEVCSEFSAAILSPPLKRFLFPLTSLKPDQSFEFSGWALLPPSKMAETLAGTVRLDRLKPDQMPLFADDGEEGQPVGCWLHIFSPAIEHAQKLKRIILGAVALSSIRRERHLFSMRANSDGYVSVDGDGAGRASSASHMPPIEDIIYSELDRPWLTSLSVLLTSPAKADRRKRNALEYYYNAWPLTKTERCAYFFSALEALYETESGKATAGLRAGIMTTLPSVTDTDRLKIITDLRNSIVHGGAPDAYSSSNYRKYFKKYGADIVDDVELLAERCLREFIFSGKFRPQPDPHAALIAKYQGLGVLPAVDTSTAIIG